MSNLARSYDIAYAVNFGHRGSTALVLARTEPPQLFARAPSSPDTTVADGAPIVSRKREHRQNGRRCGASTQLLNRGLSRTTPQLGPRCQRPQRRSASRARRCSN